MAFKKGHKINVGNKNHLGFKHSQKTKELLKKKSLEQFKNGMPKETKIKLSENNAKFWLGKKFSKKHIEKLRNAKKGKKLSKQHRLNLKGHIPWNKGLSSSMRGKKRPEVSKENHYRWNSNRQEIIESKNARTSTEYKKWKNDIIKRDKICQMKNSECSNKLIAHHKKEWSKFPKLRFKLSNGIALCDFHHGYIHGRR